MVTLERADNEDDLEGLIKYHFVDLVERTQRSTYIYFVELDVPYAREQSLPNSDGAIWHQQQHQS